MKFKIDDILDGYLEAMLWTEEENLEEEGADVNIYNIDKSSVRKAEKDIEQFLRKAEPYLNFINAEGSRDYADGSQIGHDFWLTRNGHGAGFWDREYASKEVLKKLSDIARSFGEVYPYAGDDGKIYAESKTSNLKNLAKEILSEKKLSEESIPTKEVEIVLDDYLLPAYKKFTSDWDGYSISGRRINEELMNLIELLKKEL